MIICRYERSEVQERGLVSDLFLVTFQPVNVDKQNLPLIKKYQKSFSEILKAIGLLGAKFIFLIPFRIAFCFKILKICSNNQNVFFKIFLTIFHSYLCDKYSKSNPNFKFKCQTFLDRL